MASAGTPRRNQWWLGWLPPLACIAIFTLPDRTKGVVLIGFAAVLALDFAIRGRRRSRRRMVSQLSLVGLCLLIAAGALGWLSTEASALLFAPFVVVIAFSLATDEELWDTVSPTRRRRFGAWIGAIAALAIATTAVIVHQADGLAPGDKLGSPAGWAAVFVALLLAAFAVGGLWVFSVGSRLLVVGIWGFAAAFVPLVLLFPSLAILGEERPDGVVGSCLDGEPRDCSGFAGIAGYIVAVSPPLLLAIFLLAYAVKRLVVREPAD